MPATDLAHPMEDRPLSVEEYACIQEFPQDWVVCGSILDQYKQIGNAVPVLMADQIAKKIEELSIKIQNFIILDIKIQMKFLGLNL